MWNAENLFCLSEVDPDSYFSLEATDAADSAKFLISKAIWNSIVYYLIIKSLEDTCRKIMALK